jgi:hypothetical protein
MMIDDDDDDDGDGDHTPTPTKNTARADQMPCALHTSLLVDASSQNELKLANKRLYLKKFFTGLCPRQPHREEDGENEGREGEGEEKKGKGRMWEGKDYGQWGGCVMTLWGDGCPC